MTLPPEPPTIRTPTPTGPPSAGQPSTSAPTTGDPSTDQSWSAPRLPASSHFLDETAIEPEAQASSRPLSASNGVGLVSGRWRTRLSSAWNIGENANGGYALSPVLRAMQELTDLPHPLSVTTHFFRPTTGDQDADISAAMVRQGRKFATLSGQLSQEGKQKIEVMALFGRLGGGAPSPGAPRLWPPAPDLPPPEHCVPRSAEAQGVHLALLDRVEIRVHPDHAQPGQSSRAMTEGWIRFRDLADPSPLSLPFFSDAFPPSVFSLLGMIGWVPTLELTVHVRAVPSPGWLRGRFVSDDLQDGLFIESGQLWDSTGQLVAQSRQLALLLHQPSPST